MSTERTTALPTKDYLSYREMANLLDMRVATLRKWKCMGKITYTTLRGRVYFPVKDVLKELKRNTIKATEIQLQELDI